MQQQLAGIAEGRAAITDFMASGALASLPEDIRGKFIAIANEPSWVPQVVNIAELLYARQADVTAEARDLAGSLASLASANFFFDMNVAGRGDRISLAMRRENGEDAPEGASFPDAETDPIPLDRFVATPAPEAP